LAKDASSAGDWIVAENYFQHAEHYIRIINEFDGSFDAGKITGETKKKNMSDDAGNKNENAGRKPNVADSKAEKVEDLSLPASIIGEKPAVKSDKVQEDVAG